VELEIVPLVAPDDRHRSAGVEPERGLVIDHATPLSSQ
jgi:hypothetical protein